MCRSPLATLHRNAQGRRQIPRPGVYRVDMETGAEGPLAAWPSPRELWDEAFPTQNLWRDRFAAAPFMEKGGDWALRH